jgi:hypothetical protein
MYVSGKMIPVECIPEIKENGRESEFKYYIL